MKPQYSSLILLTLPLLSSVAVAAETKIVSWNLGAAPIERILARAEDFRRLDAALQPDVLVLIEASGVDDVKAIARALGWPIYYAAVSDFGAQRAEIHFALEVGVISKIPIETVIEHDAGPDRRTHPVLTNADPNGDDSVSVREVQLKGVTNMGVGRSDRGTLQVDLQNGLTIMPVHLKSNSNATCFAASDATSSLKRLGIAAPAELGQILALGSAQKAKSDADNAQKRERVIAAVKTVGDALAEAGRQVLIAGDYNTSFEEGKAGSSFDDCMLLPFSCEKAPFPAAVCTGDGYDDTFAILTGPLVGNMTWQVLTEDLGRTYDDKAFADRAIDHLSVPSDQSSAFSVIGKGKETFGSDHFPVYVTFER